VRESLSRDSWASKSHSVEWMTWLQYLARTDISLLAIACRPILGPSHPYARRSVCRVWSRSVTSIWWRGLEWVELYSHSPVRLRSVLLNHGDKFSFARLINKTPPEINSKSCSNWARNLPKFEYPVIKHVFDFFLKLGANRKFSQLLRESGVPNWHQIVLVLCGPREYPFILENVC
jgi:hypothetical protein